METKIKHWLILYDIRDAKRLNKVAKTLESYGWRLQKSIFELSCEQKQIEHIKHVLEKIIDITEDFVLIFCVCENDYQKREMYGKVGETEPMKEPYVFL